MKIVALTSAPTNGGFPDGSRIVAITNKTLKTKRAQLALASGIPTARSRCRSLYTHTNTVILASDAERFALPVISGCDLNSVVKPVTA